MYAHGIASIALCEAYGLTKDPKLEEPATKAIDFIKSHANVVEKAAEAEKTEAAE